tara:strand:- start:1802 stop:2998 length:1197 start_codon:yes stop_codon:yes gene_type:complete
MSQCVILVGGKGSRLGDIAKDCPKPMIEVNERPFLMYLIDMVQRFGFEEILLLASHANNIIIEYFKNFDSKNCKIKIIIEEIPLGTGGAIINAYEHLEDTFYCINGDSIIEGNWISLNPILKDQYKAVIALTEVNNSSRYGSVEIDNEKIVDFHEKNSTSDSNLINAGIYLLKKEIFKNYKKNFISLEKDIFPKLLKLKELAGKKINGYFIDIGTPESLKEAKSRIWGKNKKAIIFDRDGTLNVDNGYTYKAEELLWVNGAKDLIKYLNDLNYFVFVATNQAGIAKGRYEENDMHYFHNTMQKSLFKIGAHIDKFYYCPYHIDGVIEKYKLDSKDRKPNIGMLEKISSDWNLSKEEMIFIGDRTSDMKCAENFNIQGFLYNEDRNLYDFFMEKVLNGH